jgi:hypothetical protein
MEKSFCFFFQKEALAYFLSVPKLNQSPKHPKPANAPPRHAGVRWPNAAGARPATA